MILCCHLPTEHNAGFFRSIALRNRDALQDTLRLLTLWFKYGAHDDVSHAMAGGFSKVEVDTWLEVIPQVCFLDIAWSCRSKLEKDYCTNSNAPFEHSQKHQQLVDRSWQASSASPHLPSHCSLQIFECCSPGCRHCDYGADARAQSQYCVTSKFS